MPSLHQKVSTYLAALALPSHRRMQRLWATLSIHRLARAARRQAMRTVSMQKRETENRLNLIHQQQQLTPAHGEYIMIADVINVIYHDR